MILKELLRTTVEKDEFKQIFWEQQVFKSQLLLLLTACKHCNFVCLMRVFPSIWYINATLLSYLNFSVILKLMVVGTTSIIMGAAIISP